MIPKGKTDRKLIASLKKAAGRPMSKEEIDLQRVSFVFGNLPSNSKMTREEVEKRLRENKGA